jgi:hypothetical protein
MNAASIGAIKLTSLLLILCKGADQPALFLADAGRPVLATQTRSALLLPIFVRHWSRSQHKSANSELIFRVHAGTKTSTRGRMHPLRSRLLLYGDD